MLERVIKLDADFESSSAAQLVQTASRFKSKILLVSNEKTANAKSIMGIFSLDLHGGLTVKVIADGEDEQQAILELENILGEKS